MSALRELVDMAHLQQLLVSQELFRVSVSQYWLGIIFKNCLSKCIERVVESICIYHDLALRFTILS